MKISIIIPCYNEAESITLLLEQIQVVMDRDLPDYFFEIIVIDDGSIDGTVNALKKFAFNFELKIIIFHQNSGKSLALMSGFKYATGDFIISMDGDLQDSPDDIPRFIKKLLSGYDLVSGWRKSRRDSMVRKIGSKVYNWTIHALTGMKIHDQNSGFKAYRAELVKRLYVYGQFHRYLPLQAYLLGARVDEIVIKNNYRLFGSSKYKTFRYQGLFDLMSVLFTFKFLHSPLHFFGSIGFMLIIPGTITLLYLLINHLLFVTGIGGVLLVDRPMLFLATVLILIGSNITLTGFVCDFILHHDLRKNIDIILASTIKKIE